jgi:hypothetical protein
MIMQNFESSRCVKLRHVLVALFELLLNWLQLTNNCFENRHEHVRDMKHSMQGLKVIPVLIQDFAMAWSVTNNALKPYVS